MFIYHISDHISYLYDWLMYLFDYDPTSLWPISIHIKSHLIRLYQLMFFFHTVSLTIYLFMFDQFPRLSVMDAIFMMCMLAQSVVSFVVHLSTPCSAQARFYVLGRSGMTSSPPCTFGHENVKSDLFSLVCWLVLANGGWYDCNHGSSRWICTAS